MSHDESDRNHVTAFAIGPDDRYYCCGEEDGSVIIHESTDGKVCSYTWATMEKTEADSSPASDVVGSANGTEPYQRDRAE